jgi:hypothetical protein
MSDSKLLQEKLLSLLAEERDLTIGRMKNPAQFHYKGIADFLLREAQFFEPRPLPAGIEYLEIKHCIKNAFWSALQERFVYVEGYAVSSWSNVPLLHAWNLDQQGFVVDTTWNPHGRAYFGVIFPLATIPRKRSTQYSVIDDWEHGYPILRKAWYRETSGKQAFDELSLLKS